MTKRRVIVVAAVVFFFGLPLASILMPYMSIHRAMRASGEKFLHQAAPEVFGPEGWKALYGYGTLTLKRELTEEAYDAWKSGTGQFHGVNGVSVVRSWVSTRGDQGWQFVAFKGTVDFANSDVPLKITVARRSTRLDEWRIESISLTGQDVE